MTGDRLLIQNIQDNSLSLNSVISSQYLWLVTPLGSAMAPAKHSPHTISANSLHSTTLNHSKTDGTKRQYQSSLNQADRWLVPQVDRMLNDQNHPSTISESWTETNSHLGVDGPASLPDESNIRLPDGKAAYNAFATPMECTPLLISLFLISKCMPDSATEKDKLGLDKNGPSQSRKPCGESTIKMICAAFEWRFGAL